MQEIFEYIDEMNPLILLGISLGLYLIARYIGKRHLEKHKN